MYDNFAFPRKWTFGEGSGLYPQITVKANEYHIAWERAKKGLDARYFRAQKEPPVAWSLTLIGVELIKK